MSDRPRRRERIRPATEIPEPTDEEKRTTWRNVRRTAVAMLVAALVLAVFNSDGLSVWARNLPGHPVSDRIVYAADQWHELMQTLGPARISQTVRDFVQDLRYQGW